MKDHVFRAPYSNADACALCGKPAEAHRGSFARMTVDAKFKYGDAVFKWTGAYTGPGIVRGLALNEHGQIRYLVGHKIEGGTGEFLHVYSEGNLRVPE